MSPPRIPSSTYRLQFNQKFTFKQALELVTYFRDLGISDLYASPIMKSMSGSIHGYDVLNPCQLNPEIGSEEEFEQLAKALHESQMGFLLDIVPNHMSIASSENKWWQDVLENGSSSLYAHYFNVIWDPPKPELKNKVLLAVLDQQYGKVIENQELKIVFEAGAFFVEYHDRRFPVNPITWPAILNPVVEELTVKLGEKDSHLLELQSIITALDHLPVTTEEDLEKSKVRAREKEIIKRRLVALTETSTIIHESIEYSMLQLNGQKGDPHSFDRLEELLNQQAYRLSFWRVTNEEINYRRFFDVNDLINMHVETEEVFEAMHELVLKYVNKGWITGFRIDHVDGLFDPQHYFIRLQKACALALGETKEKVERNFYLLIEKILGENEKLCPQWLVFGTTGYDDLNLVNGLFVVTENDEQIKHIYQSFIGRHFDMSEVMYHCKKLILIISMSSELYLLAKQLEKVSEQHRWSRDFTLETLRSALRDIIASFPVYRSYIRFDDLKVSSQDREYIQRSILAAKSYNPAKDPSIFEFIQNVLLLEDPPGLTEEQIRYRRDFVMHFQQLTGPVTAKGVEDTAFYRYYPLASLNEVGMDPTYFGTDIQFFHVKNQEKLRLWPHTLLATSTHDTKRSEDVRARINVLSENPEKWKEALAKWSQLNRSQKEIIDKREVPDANEEYLIYQTLIGTWPLYPMDAPGRMQYVERISNYMLKALKEAKIHTSWVNPNESYEKGVAEFIHRILEINSENLFLKEFEAFIQSIMRAGMFNSLSQILLKMTIPGVPDFYQGNELWQFHLVDPDNRQQIDYVNRRHLLTILKKKAEEDALGLLTDLLQTPEDGRIKLYVTFQMLNFRLKHPALFQQGNYIPIEIKGEKSKHVVAFSRDDGQKQIIVAVGRFYTQLSESNEWIPPTREVWKDTMLVVPSQLQGTYRDIFSGQIFSTSENHDLPLEHAFSIFPLVVLERC